MVYKSLPYALVCPLLSFLSLLRSSRVPPLRPDRSPSPFVTPTKRLIANSCYCNQLLLNTYGGSAKVKGPPCVYALSKKYTCVNEIPLSRTCLMIKSVIGTDYKELFRSCYTICLKSIHFKNKPVSLYYKRIKSELLLYLL